MYEVRQERLLAAGAYILFFLPLLSGGSRFGRFHCNQGLVLLLFYTAVSVVAHFVPVVGETLLLPAAKILWLLLAVWGILGAWQGRMRRLPLVGRFGIIR